MQLKLIEELAGVVARTGIEELEYSCAGVRIRLQRSVSGQALPQAPMTPPADPRPAPAAAALPVHAVLAGMSGTFCCAPAPGQAPFVKVGDVVQEGQVLAIVEAMKMLNQIEADASGRIVRVALEDGATVTPASVLFEILPLEQLP